MMRMILWKKKGAEELKQTALRLLWRGGLSAWFCPICLGDSADFAVCELKAQCRADAIWLARCTTPWALVPPRILAQASLCRRG